MRYADPKQLPGYPSPGVRMDDSAVTAASLGWASQKSRESEKPKSWAPASASAAAAIAAASPKTAARLRSQTNPLDGRRSQPVGAQTQKEHGASTGERLSQSVAEPCSRKSAEALRQSGFGGLGEQPSLVAAQGALRGVRRRSRSSPQLGCYGPNPTPKNSGPSSSALSAATLAHKPSMQKSLIERAGAVPVTSLPREMCTSRPPVQPEVEAQKTADRIHAAAVLMARRMFSQQQRMVDAAKRQADAAPPNPGSKSPRVSPADQHESAYELAQARLSKLQDEHRRNREYQDYYGTPGEPRRRFSIATSLRRKSTSGENLTGQARTDKVRRQLSVFASKLPSLDLQKRQRDREAVLVAATRNVRARLEGMDKQISASTGRIPSSKIGEWETKAHAAARAKYETIDPNWGKRNLGGGKYMDQEEIEAIAKRRVQPLLDDIDQRAAEETERKAATQAEKETRRFEADQQRARDREVKDIHRRLKGQQKQVDRERRQIAREAERAKKDEEKAKKQEQRAARREQERTEKQDRERQDRMTAVLPRIYGDGPSSSSSSSGEEFPTANPAEAAPRPLLRVEAGATASEDPGYVGVGGSPKEKMKNWIKDRLSHRRPSQGDVEQSGKRSSFVGGATLRDRESTPSLASLDGRPASMREVAFAGKGTDSKVGRNGGHREMTRMEGPDSSVSSLTDGDTYVEAREAQTPSPVKPIGGRLSKTGSPTRDSRFVEMIE